MGPAPHRGRRRTADDVPTMATLTQRRQHESQAIRRSARRPELTVLVGDAELRIMPESRDYDVHVLRERIARADYTVDPREIAESILRRQIAGRTGGAR